MAPPRLLAAAVLVLALLACSRAAPCTIGDGMADWVAADASGPELAKLAAPAAANYIKTVMEADAKTHGFDCSAAAKSVAAEVTAACSQPDKEGTAYDLLISLTAPCRNPAGEVVTVSGEIEAEMRPGAAGEGPARRRMLGA